MHKISLTVCSAGVKEKRIKQLLVTMFHPEREKNNNQTDLKKKNLKPVSE